MVQMNVLEARNSLSRILREIELGHEDRYVIARNGVPIAELVPYSEPKPAVKALLARERGVQLVPDGWDVNGWEDFDIFAGTS